MTSLDVEKIRADFPILDRQINGQPLIYLDSGNTSQKPRQVIDAVREHYERHNANVARSVHTLGTEATEAYERSRVKIAAFVGASDAGEIVFAKNSTEAINLVAHAFSAGAADPRLPLRAPGPVRMPQMRHPPHTPPRPLA